MMDYYKKKKFNPNIKTYRYLSHKITTKILYKEEELTATNDTKQKVNNTLEIG